MRSLGVRLFMGLTLSLNLSEPVPGKPAVGPSGRLADCVGFCAGVGRADITPPPGVGLAGNGPEGKRAVGYRMRLFVRAMILKDTRGESVALVVADLAHISPTLHRMTAARVAGRTGLTADRLVMSATHTHAGPSHFYSERQYNAFGSSVPGYDTAVVTYLVDAFTRAILQAADSLRPARAAWGQIPIWGFTRNRSYPAYLENKPEWTPPFPVPAGVDPVHRAVDPTWTMLRVDVRDPSGAFRPVGAFSIFSIHGTANPPDGDLIDADIHGLLERGLEDFMAGRNSAYRPRSVVHLVANGTEGDVSPDWPQGARCGIPRIQPVLRPGGPRTPAGPWEWLHPDSTLVTRCIKSARDFMTAAADSMTGRFLRLYDSLGSQLTDTLAIAVAFRIDSLPNLRGLCPAPFTGVSTTAGAEDGPTRLRGWRLFGLFNLGFEEGGSAVNPHPSGCHREKRIAFGESLQNLLTGKNALASVAQLTVVRIGDLLLGATPAEVTTVAGYQMKQAVRDSVLGSQGRAGPVALIGMANGYIQYVTTDAEYRVQHYEGGSTIYGPRSAAVLGEQLGGLAGAIVRAGGRSPVNRVYDLVANPGDTVSVLPGRNSGLPPNMINRRVVEFTCRADTIVLRWLDAWPGRHFPAETHNIVLFWTPGYNLPANSSRRDMYGWDGDPNVEIRAIGPMKGEGYVWEARFAGFGISPGGFGYRVFARRAGFPVELTGTCPSLPPAPDN